MRQWHGKSETMWAKIADWMPRKLVYFCVIRCWSHATTGPWSSCAAPDVTIEQALKRWEDRDA